MAPRSCAGGMTPRRSASLALLRSPAARQASPSDRSSAPRNTTAGTARGRDRCRARGLRRARHWLLGHRGSTQFRRSRPRDEPVRVAVLRAEPACGFGKLGAGLVGIAGLGVHQCEDREPCRVVRETLRRTTPTGSSTSARPPRCLRTMRLCIAQPTTKFSSFPESSRAADECLSASLNAPDINARIAARLSANAW